MFKDQVASALEGVAARIRLRRLLDMTLPAAHIASWCILAVLLADRLAYLRLFGWSWTWTLPVAVAAVAVAAGIAWFAPVQPAFRLAVKSDEALGLKTTLSTYLALPKNLKDPEVAEIIRRQAVRQASGIEPRRVTPIRVDRKHALALLPVVLTLSVCFLVDQKDLLGILQRQRESGREVAVTAEAADNFSTETERLVKEFERRKELNRAIGRDVGDVVQSMKKLAEAARKSTEKNRTDDSARKMMLKQLNETRSEMERVRAKYDKAREIAKAMDRLRERQASGSDDPGVLDDMRNAMADKRFRDAARKTRQLKNKLQKKRKPGSLDKPDTEQMRKTAEEFRKLSKELEDKDPELAKKMKNAADKLEQAAEEYEQMETPLTPDELAQMEELTGNTDKELDRTLDDLANDLEDYGQLGDSDQSLAELEDFENVLNGLENNLGQNNGRIHSGRNVAGRGKISRGDRLARLRKRGAKVFGKRGNRSGSDNNSGAGNGPGMGGSGHGRGGKSTAEDDPDKSGTWDVGLEGEMRSNKIIAVDTFRGIGKTPERYSENYVEQLRSVTDKSVEAMENTYIPERRKETVRKYFEALQGGLNK